MLRALLRIIKVVDIVLAEVMQVSVISLGCVQGMELLMRLGVLI